MSDQQAAVLTNRRYLNIDNLAEQLGISASTIYRMRSVGEDLPKAFKIGTQLRWRQETVDAWVAGQEDAA